MVPRETKIMKIKDHFLSKESFELVKNTEFGFYETRPKLAYDQLKTYYDNVNYLSHQEKSNNLKSFVYNLVKKFMFHQKYKWIKKYVDQGSWLDFGAGTGEFLEYIPKYWNKIAFEPNEKALELIKAKKIDYVSDYQYFNGKADVISAFHALEHVIDIHKWFDFINKISHQDTILAIAVPNYQAFDAKYYKEYWAAYDLPRHQYHFSKEGVCKLFRKYNYQLIDEKPLLFDAYYISMISEKYKGNNDLLNAIRTGFLSNKKAKRTGEYSSNLFIFSHLQK